jgi:hypothetical protein
MLKGIAMKLKFALFTLVILSALFLSAFGSPAAPQHSVRLQDTVVAPDVTLVPPTVVVVEGTPAVIPVTGNGDAPSSLWTLLLFGLLGLLGIAFLVALFSPRTTIHEHHEHIDTPPHDHDV